MLRSERGWFVVWGVAVLVLGLAGGVIWCLTPAGRFHPRSVLIGLPSVWLSVSVLLNRGTGRSADPFLRAAEQRLRDVTVLVTVFCLVGYGMLAVEFAANLRGLPLPGGLLSYLPHPGLIVLGMLALAFGLLVWNAVGWHGRRQELLAADDPDSA